MTEVGHIIFQRNYKDDTVKALGTIPKRVAISLDFIEGGMGIRREGDDVYLDCLPALHLRLLHAHPRFPHTYVAEVVTK